MRRLCFLLRVCLLAVAAASCTPYAMRHVVQPGETAARVARLYGVEEQELRAFNRLQAGDRLGPGDVVFVPGDRSPRPSPGEPLKEERVQAPVVASRPVPPAPPEPVRERAPESRRASDWVWPVKGEVLVGFGSGPAGESRGIDIAVPVGSEVRAVAGGVATYAGTPAPAYGPIVIVEHSPGLFTVYSHLEEARVEKGQRLRKGEVLGSSGPAGNGKPAHLHFEVRRNEKAVDPLLFLPVR